jgi:acyl-[acyl-carrier-protein]-phospholipid O-acyltransferase/long-chain-fatty-acid--[acyl-carrier-protein] ligase
VYRIKVKGAENVPTQGPALLAANHVGWLDAFLLGATQQRRIRFIMSREIFQKSVFRPIFRLMRVILISSKDPPKQIIQSLRQARQALDEGQLVCIFPEGVITRNGMVQGFRGGLERILRGSDYPIIPVYIGGAWGSIFSYQGGRIGGWPRRIPYPVSIHFGKPMSATSEAWQVRQQVMELSTDFFNDRASTRRPLGGLFVQTARRHWQRPCISDTTGRHLTYGQTLTAASLLAKRITEKTGPAPRIGVLLPPSVAAAVTHVALALLRKVSVNLNYTASDQAREAALCQCHVQHVITSMTFLIKLGLDPSGCNYLFVEDLLGSFGLLDKMKAWLKARVWPSRLLCPAKGFHADDEAAILLSSGSTGQAKAVTLSHHNIESNLEQMRMVFRVTPHDRFCGVLPLFHCFGLTITLWFPLMNGAAVSFIPNPLDGKAVADSVRKDQCTLLLATPTFLQVYLRRAEATDLASLREVIVGAEKLTSDLADAFEQRFGIRPHEGYGATELSPLVSINLPAVEIDGVRQVGSKPGSVGQSIPGIALKVTDPDTGQVLAPGQQGLLWIKGPNVMRGYLNAPDLTGDAIQDGWYNTGDIVTIDEDGFIFITDRLSRFSKIGGEMVPHVQVEQVCASTVKTSERIMAVTGIPDPVKGEELVVLYVPIKACPERMYEAITASTLPNLWKPRHRSFIPVESIPILGSGKLDIQRLRHLALEQVDSAAVQTQSITPDGRS